MPDGKTHRQIGIGAAVLVEGLRAIEEPAALKLAALLGAAAGGAMGAAVPDVLEPAIHPHHRDYCHGAAISFWLATTGFASITAASELMRKQSEMRRAARIAQSANPANEPSVTIAEFAERVLAALLIGVLVGYVSHVLADAATKRGVPIFARQLL